MTIPCLKTHSRLRFAFPEAKEDQEAEVVEAGPRKTMRKIYNKKGGVPTEAHRELKGMINLRSNVIISIN